VSTLAHFWLVNNAFSGVEKGVYLGCKNDCQPLYIGTETFVFVKIVCPPIKKSGLRLARFFDALLDFDHHRQDHWSFFCLRKEELPNIVTNLVADIVGVSP
jgi:hypothetical protein